MKKSILLSFIIIGLSFQSCKNNKSKPADLENNTTETTEVQETLDTTNVIAIDTLQTKEIVSEEVKEIVITTEEAIKSIDKKVDEVEKTTSTIKKEETVVKDIVEEKADEMKKEIEPVTEDIGEKVEKTVVETKIVENVVEKEAETKTEPVVEKVPEKVEVKTNSWVVPSKYLSMKNPTDPKVDLSIGKNLYSKHCKSCHGAEGYGDGSKADEMNGDLGDFSSRKFQAQTDGALFYKTTFGRDDMPEYTKKMPDDEDRWLIVNYMRTLAE